MNNAKNVKRINIEAKRIFSWRIDIALSQNIFIEFDIEQNKNLNQIVQLKQNNSPEKSKIHPPTYVNVD